MSHPDRQVVSCIQRMNALGVEKLSYSGGEPLLYPLLPECVDHAATVGMHQILTTNGDVLFHRSFPWLAHLEYLKLSFYGSARSHDRVMGDGHYSRLLDVARRESQKGIRVGANIVLSALSQGELAQFFSEAAAAGIDSVLCLSYMHGTDEQTDALMRLPVGTDGTITGTLEHVAAENAQYCDLFPSGIKIHNYDYDDFFIVLDDEDRFTMPRGACSYFIMGGLFDATLRLPDGRTMDAAKALEAVWSIRRESAAITPLRKNESPDTWTSAIPQ